MLRKLFTKKFVIAALGAALALFVLIQFIPMGNVYGQDPILNEPPWDSAQTRALAKRACFDCHSNETEWPWYAKVQPMAFMISRDVEAGRALMNFSEWKEKTFITADLIEKMIRSDQMPLPRYLLAHPGAKLSDAEKETLIEGIRETLKYQQNLR